MKPTATEAERARSCRYVVYEDEYDEAIARGLPLPRYFAPHAQGFEPQRMDREVQPEAGWRVVLRCVQGRVDVVAGQDHRPAGTGSIVKAVAVEDARAAHNRLYVHAGDGDRSEAERKDLIWMAS
jgi:hypothetical protein